MSPPAGPEGEPHGSDPHGEHDHERHRCARRRATSTSTPSRGSTSTPSESSMPAAPHPRGWAGWRAIRAAGCSPSARSTTASPDACSGHSRARRPSRGAARASRARASGARASTACTSWGDIASFRSSRASSPSAVDGAPCIALDYDLPDNPGFIRAIHDEVREVESGLYLGPAMWKAKTGPRLVLGGSPSTRAGPGAAHRGASGLPS